MTQQRSVATQWLVGAALLAGIIYLLRPILIPFVAAGILAYLCAPLMSWLCAHRVPRAAAALAVMALLLCVLVSFMLLLVPVVQREIEMFSARLPALIETLRLKIMPFLRETLHLDVQWDGESLRNLLTVQWQQSAGSVADKVLPWLGGGSAALLNLLMNAVMLPVVLFYLLRDWPAILGRLEELVPHRWNRLASQLVTESNAVLSEFLHGQIVVMLVMSAFYVAGLWLTGLQFALPIGLVAGMLVVIPYVGMITGLVLATIASATQLTSFGSMLLVWAVFGAGQVLEGMVLTPRLVGERIGLHPLALIFALLAFGQLFGFFGVLLALPVSAVLLVGLRHARQHYLASPLYRE